MGKYFIFLSSLQSHLSFPVCAAHNGSDPEERHQEVLIKPIWNSFLFHIS